MANSPKDVAAAQEAKELIAAQLSRSGELLKAFWPLDESDKLVDLLIGKGFKVVSKAAKPKTYNSNVTLLQARRTVNNAGDAMHQTVTFYSSQGGLVTSSMDINTYLPELAQFN